MNRIAITGAGGRMGKALIDAILLNGGAELTVALERPESSGRCSAVMELKVIDEEGNEKGQCCCKR